MNEDSPPNPPKQPPWYQRLLRRSHSGRNLSGQSRRNVTDGNQSTPRPSSQAAATRGRHMFCGNISCNIFNFGRSRTVGQSPHPPLMPSHPIPQVPLPDYPQDPLPDTNPTHAQHTKPSNAKDGSSDLTQIIEGAKEALVGMKYLPGTVQKVPSAINGVQSGLDTVDTVDTLMEPLKIFNLITNKIADIHPYAKIVLGVFTCASTMIINQKDRDNAVQDLLQKLSEVYKFMNEDKRLAERLTSIPTMQAVYGTLARQTQVCAEFIVHYSETESPWKRMVRDVLQDKKTKIQTYSDALDAVMQKFRDHAALRILAEVDRIGVDLDLKDMAYEDGVGRNSSKCCLPRTREEILSEIKTWVGSTGEDVERVFWLSGTAGKGKSAIAHTIAHWFYENGGAGACFCFAREAEQRHKKIFTTIARDLADRDPIIWLKLAKTVKDNELRHTADIMRQWKELILGPVDAVSKAVAAPVLIVIDALDESGDTSSREQILRVLASKLDPFSSERTTLPENMRVLVTSRPLPDIHESLHTAPHVRHVSMDDITHVPTESSYRDIQHYISTKLKDSPYLNFNDKDFEKLAEKSDGLFEWARLACEYIKGTGKLGVSPNKRFEAVVEETSAKGTRLLDKMYERILEEIMPQDEQEEAIPMFRSVMGQILASLEPLSTTVLNEMRDHFPHNDDRYNVDEIIRSLGSLVAGSADSPIRPLHASFYDFLTDKSRSNTFFVDKSLAQGNLAFALLGVMKHELRFNICSLENSYLPNSAIDGLDKRVERTISTQLSYSCRFWGSHAGATSAEPPLAEEVRAFFDGERLLFWLEAVALLKALSGSVATLECIAKWLMGHPEYTDIADAVGDTLRFVQTFGPAISHSTPHLYLSALPFAPMQSMIFKKFFQLEKFPRTPRAVGGHVEYWPPMEKIIHINRDVHTMAISPDKRHIVCGLEDRTIRILDIVTGEALGAPLVGHTHDISSIAISQTGDRVVSVSKDGAIWVWDAGAGKILSAPPENHTCRVRCVAISPDGTRIVSSSEDATIRVWDVGTRKALYAPLEGHTVAVLGIAISPDGHRIVSCSFDGIRTWNMNSGAALGAVRFIRIGSYFKISLDGNRIALKSINQLNRIEVLDASTGKLLCLVGQGDSVVGFTFLSDGNSIVTGSESGIIQIWDAQTGEALGTPLRGHTAAVTCLTVSPHGSRIISFSTDRTIRVWDVDVRNALDAPFHGHIDDILCVAISPDGKHILSGSADKTICVWDMVTGGALCAPIGGHTNRVSSVAINGNLIVSGSDDGTVRMWDAMTHKAVGALPKCGVLQSIESVAISPDGMRIVLGLTFGMMICTWDSGTGWKLGEIHGEQAYRIMALAISLDGNLIVSGSNDGTIQVWDMITREELGASLKHNLLSSIAISPDKKLIVSGSYLGEICLWNRVTGEASGVPPRKHTNRIMSIAISLDGNLIVSSSCDKTIRLWDARTGEAFGAPLRGHSSAVNSIAISPDSKCIVSGSRDKTIRVWDLEFFTQPQSFNAPAIYFSSNLTHALCSPSSFLQDLHDPIPLLPNEDGWVVGPEGRLLLWIPASLYPAVYTPGTTLVISQDDGLRLDLSHFAHGTAWQECRADDGRQFCDNVRA